MMPCPTCGGDGAEIEDREDGGLVEIPCTGCDGTGEVDESDDTDEVNRGIERHREAWIPA